MTELSKSAVSLGTCLHWRDGVGETGTLLHIVHAAMRFSAVPAAACYSTSPSDLRVGLAHRTPTTQCREPEIVNGCGRESLRTQTVKAVTQTQDGCLCFAARSQSRVHGSPDCRVVTLQTWCKGVPRAHPALAQTQGLKI